MQDRIELGYLVPFEGRRPRFASTQNEFVNNPDESTP